MTIPSEYLIDLLHRNSGNRFRNYRLQEVYVRYGFMFQHPVYSR